MWTAHSDRYITDSFSCIDWIPPRLPAPPHFPIRIVVSIDPSQVGDRVAQLHKRHSAFQVNEITLTELNKECRTAALTSMLTKRGVSEAQKLAQRVAEIPASAIPMYLYMSSIYLSTASTEPERAVASLPNSLSEVIASIITRAEHEVDSGSGYVKDVLSLVCCTRRGLLEPELWEILKLQCVNTNMVPKLYRLHAVLHALRPLFHPVARLADIGGERVVQIRHVHISRIVMAKVVKHLDTETGLHKRLADMFYQGLLSLHLERLGEGTQRWLYNRVITDEQARAVSEVCYHAIRGRMVTETRELLCSLRFVELRIMLGQLAELLEDYRLAIEMCDTLSVKDGKQQIQEFEAFVKRYSKELCQRPSNTFQTAANAPLQTAPAIASRAMLASGAESRVWLQYMNQVQDQALGSDFDTGAAVLDLSATPDARFVAAAVEGSLVMIYDTFSGVLVTELSDFNHAVTCVALFPEGPQMATGSADGYVTFWDSATKVRECVLHAHMASPPAHADADGDVDGPDDGAGASRIRSPSNKTINGPGLRLRSGLGSTGPSVGLNRGTSLSLSGGARRSTNSVGASADYHRINSVRIAYDAKVLVTAGNDQTLCAIDPTLQVVVGRMHGHRGPVLDCDISRDNMFIVSASADKTLRIWSADTYECVNR
jgi:hypothetical protein